jgi:hypothetical protein
VVYYVHAQDVLNTLLTLANDVETGVERVSTLVLKSLYHNKLYLKRKRAQAFWIVFSHGRQLFRHLLLIEN